MSAETMRLQGRYRWRTRIRHRLPWFLVNLGVAAKGKRDCGDHEWYRENAATARCYHCEPGVRLLSGSADADS
ncbi:MAG: hypothetical protein QOJ29_3672 [Thermoleophilaceae bacterium]|jgi:hypothetical protein|nr:hypothetical protein [Thermoleophilaceae bacterium]